MTIENFLCADKQVLDFHRRAHEYAELVNNESFHKHRGDNSWTKRILHVLAADSIKLNQAILALCQSGWAFAANILLRTSLDALINITAITSNQNKSGQNNSEYMALKYFFSGSKNEALDSNNPEEKEEIKNTFEKGIMSLAPELKKNIRIFFNNSRRVHYWYDPEFEDPSNVIKLGIKDPGIEDLYKLLSSSVHAGFLGLHDSREFMNQYDPLPCRDRDLQNRVLVISGMILIKVCGLRDKFEACGTERHYGILVDESKNLEVFLKARN